MEDTEYEERMGNVYAILADVHGNAHALEAVLEDIRKRRVDVICHLGDLVGYGADSDTVVRIAREKDFVCVQGNHDAQLRPPRAEDMRSDAKVALDFALSQLDGDAVDWLSALPSERVVDGRLVLVHGALTGRDDYILTQEELAQNHELLETRDEHICFSGHTHTPLFSGGGRVKIRIPSTFSFDILPDERYVVNPGSVGQPRDKIPLASYALYEPAEWRLSIVRVPYDIAGAQKKMAGACLPERLWKRLTHGA